MEGMTEKQARFIQGQNILARLTDQLAKGKPVFYNTADRPTLEMLRNTRLRRLVPTSWLHEFQIKAVLKTKWFYVWSNETVLLTASDRFCPYLGEPVTWEKMGEVRIVEVEGEHGIEDGLFQPVESKEKK